MLLGMRGQPPFDPYSALFSAGEQGAWYDPSDFSRYMATGSELVTNGTFDAGTTGWVSGSSLTSTATVVDGEFRVTTTTAFGRQVQTLTLQIGRTYLVSGFIRRISGSSSAYIAIGYNTQSDSVVSSPVSSSSSTFVQFTFVPTTTTVNVMLTANASGDVVGFDNISVKELTAISTATLFQNSTGTTPVTAVEQPVGLMLDESKGLVLSSNLATGAWINTFTTAFDSFTSSTSSGFTASTTGAKTGIRVGLPCTFASGKSYRVSFKVTMSNATVTAVWFSDATLSGIQAIQSPASVTSGLTYSAIATLTVSSSYLMLIINTSGASSVILTDFVAQELPGNHAFQTTDANRPVLSARYNLLQYTEQFDNAYWSKTGLVTAGMANVTTAPDGTLTADQMIEDTSTGVHRVFSTITLAAAPHTLSFYVKDNGRQWIFIYTDTGLVTGYLNFATNTYVAGAGSATCSSVAVGNGWYRVSFSYTNTVTISQTIQIWLAQSSTVNSYTGNGTSGVYIWGADLRVTNDGIGLPVYQRVGLGTAGSGTTAGSPDYDTVGFPLYLRYNGTNSAMLTNSIGFNTVTSDGQARRNLLLAPTLFDDSYWSKTGLVTAGMANVTTAPDGTLTADQMIEDTSTGLHRLFNTITIAAGAYTLSFYVKDNGRQWLFIYADAGIVSGAFNYITNSYVASSGSATCSSASVGNGWYRVSFSYTNTTTVSQNIQVWLAQSSTVTSYTGNGTSGVYIWGAQLETGSTATTFQNIGTDKMTVFAGVRKLSDAALGMAAELSANLSSNNGTFWLLAPLGTGASGDFDASFKGTNQVQVNSGVRLAPVTAVLTANSNIAGPTAVFRYNGTQTELDTGNQGTGNFGGYPLYLGARGGTSLFFNGRLYSLIVRGAQTNSAQIAQAETWVNNKTRAF